MSYSLAVPTSLPPFIQVLFWDVDPESVDLEEHRDYVMERVMTRGGWDAMGWLRSTYDVASIARFVRARGERLAPREVAYWSLIAGLESAQRPGGGRPRWAT